MKKICIIPARMGSTRFPGKPLKSALGIPMIVHVAKRCALSTSVDYVGVATCDQEIADICRKNNIQVVMTRTSHERCTDRVSEAVNNLNFQLSHDDLVIMVQGDEILVTPQMIDQIVQDFIINRAPVTNLLSRIYRKEDHIDPNVVKVVFSLQNHALYFSRAPIPSDYRDTNLFSYQQTGIIAFARGFLEKFSDLPQTKLEKIESIDMLRVLENELPLRVVKTERETIAIDVPEDLIRAEQILTKDEIVKEYA